MKFKLILQFLLLILQIQFTLAANTHSTQYTIQNSDLIHSSLNRLSDIFKLIDEWHNITIDGFTIQAGNGDSQNYQNQNWLLIVDDQIIRNLIFGQSNLNLLGLSTDQIDSIEIFPNSTILNSSFSDKGAIHIHTKKNKSGLFPAAQFILGNQTGDPGPYRYTKYKTDNVDRIAVDKSFHISYGNSAGYVNVGQYIQVYYPTNSRIINRIKKIYKGKYKRIKSNSYSLHAGTDLLPGSPQISFYQTTMDNLFFFKPIGQEIPTRNQFLFAGLKGNFNKSHSLPLFYRMSYTKNALQKRSNIFDYDFDWQTEILEADVGYDFSFQQNKLSLGLNILKNSYNSDYFNNTQNIYSYSIYAYYFFNDFIDHNLKLNTLICRNYHGIEYTFALSDNWQINDNQTIILDFYNSKTTPLSDNSLWFWSEKGYDFVNDVNIDYELDSDLSNPKNLSLGITWKREQDVLPAISFGMQYRYIEGFNREVQTFHYNPNWETFMSPVEIRTGQQSEDLRLFFKSYYKMNKTLSGQFYFEYNKLLGNENKVKKLIPTNRLNFRLTYIPVENFSIWAMLKYQSPVFWYEYRNIYKESDGKYNANLSEIIRLDLAINKWFWHRRIKASILFNNLSNRTEIYHPVGASMDLRFFAQLEIYFKLL